MAMIYQNPLYSEACDNEIELYVDIYVQFKFILNMLSMKKV